jgi:glycerophosphoryl diester phosphodiesterase
MWHYLRLVVDWFIELFRRAPEVRRAPGRRVYNIAHRGAPCFEVENTIPSFRRAMEIDGAAGIEFDLCMTSDGVVVVWHDWDPHDEVCKLRISGMEPDVKYCPCLPADERYQRPVHELTYREFIENFGYTMKEGGDGRVDAHIPTLDEVMAWAVTCETIEVIFFDIKIPECMEGLVPEMIERIEEVVARHAPRFTIVLETMYENILAAMKREAPDREFTLDVEPPIGVMLDPDSFSAMGPALRHGNRYATTERPRPTTLAPWTSFRRVVEHDIALRDGASRGGDRGPAAKLVAFTVNDPEEMRSLVRMGIDGIQTDRPDLFARVLAEEGAMGVGAPDARRAAATPVA